MAPSSHHRYSQLFRSMYIGPQDFAAVKQPLQSLTTANDQIAAWCDDTLTPLMSGTRRYLDHSVAWVR